MRHNPVAELMHCTVTDPENKNLEVIQTYISCSITFFRKSCRL